VSSADNIAYNIVHGGADIKITAVSSADNIAGNIADDSTNGDSTNGDSTIGNSINGDSTNGDSTNCNPPGEGTFRATVAGMQGVRADTAPRMAETRYHQRCLWQQERYPFAYLVPSCTAR
jgi:hypothetical protein